MGKRILHLIGGMHPGEVQTWLMQILRHIDRKSFQMDFLVHTTQHCVYDEEIFALGSRIIPCQYPSALWVYASNFKQILGKYGTYDVVHSHLNYFSGYVLRLAQQMGVLTRIAHSHVDNYIAENPTEFSQQLYFTLMKGWINRYATHGLGFSHNALVNLFGEEWQTDSRWQIVCPFSMEKSLLHLQSVYQTGCTG